MVNTLLIFLAFVGFLLFGYASLIRLLARRHLASSSPVHANKPTRVWTIELARNLGSSAFFVSLPATAILLFWGWGPALIWLAVFHFFVDSLFQLQYCSQQHDGNTKKSVADFMLRTDSGLKAVIEQGLIQAFFLLSMAVVVALVATLIDRQPGLLFALVCLIPARKLLSHTSPAIALPIKIVGAGILLCIGLIFSDQLGFSVYGDWVPFGSFVPWLVFNMPTLIAGIIVVSVFQLETNHGFKQDLSLLAGVIICVLVFAMIVKLIFLQPTLDAPLNISKTDNSELPAFISLSLFVFAGFAAILVRLLNEEENRATDAKPIFYRLQLGSAVHCIYMSLLALSLAAALGIGAWKTHFIDWSQATNMLDFLNLAISSNLNLIYSDADAGTLLHTVLLAALCFTGFSFLLMCANQLSLEEAEKVSAWSLIVEAKLPQALGIFVASAFFISAGISVNAWLIIGILAWVLFCQLAIGMALHAQNQRLFAIATLVLIGAGLIQIVLLTLVWLQQSNFFTLLCAFTVLAFAGFVWISDLKLVVKKLSKNEKVELF